MKPSHAPLLLVASLGLGLVAAQAADKKDKAPALQEKPPRPTLNRFGFSYRPGFNIKANFQNLGLGASAPGPAVGGVTHTYDDGFVDVDSSGNFGNQTWFWGYANNSQIAGGNLLLTSSQAGSLGQDAQQDPQHGFEFTYSRELLRSRNVGLGIESAFNFTKLKLDRQTAAAGMLVVDAYNLGGIIPPLAPYAGTFAGPGALISDTPARSLASVASEFRASVYGFRLGPCLDVPLFKKLSLSLSGGLAVAYVDGDFGYRQSATPAGAGTVARGATESLSRWHTGAYLGGNLVFKLSRSVDVFAGVQYQNVGTHTQSLADKQVNVDLRNSLFATFGLGYAF